MPIEVAALLRRPRHEGPRRVRHDRDTRRVHRQRPRRFRLGTVGRAEPGVEVRSPTTARSSSAARSTPAATSTAPRRPPPSSSTTTAGCTPATSAPSTRTASSRSSTARRNSSSPPAARTSHRPTSRTTSRSTRSSARPSPTATARPYVVAILTLDGEVAPAGPRPRASSSPPWPNWPSTPRSSRWPQDAVANANASSHGPAGQAWRLLPRGVDGRDRGAHPQPQAQAPGHPRQVRRRRDRLYASRQECRPSTCRRTAAAPGCTPRTPSRRSVRP